MQPRGKVVQLGGDGSRKKFSHEIVLAKSN
jgi:hypothetical protein